MTNEEIEAKLIEHDHSILLLTSAIKMVGDAVKASQDNFVMLLDQLQAMIEKKPAE